MGILGILQTSYKVERMCVKADANRKILQRRIENTVKVVCSSIESATVVIDRVFDCASSDTKKHSWIKILKNI